jgi:hypothetical protein
MLDVELEEGAPELRHATIPLGLGGSDPEDARLVAVEGDRLAMRLEVGSGRREVVERRL